jgi:hypothetical protein
MGYSAHVEIWLHTGGRQLELAQIGPEWFTVRDESFTLPPSEAEVTLRVDDQVERLRVYLHNGVQSEQRKTYYEQIGPKCYEAFVPLNSEF